jgi:NAD(P)-dependent dehydrogenase (short-subunit alcohol dehydrogenase family)
VVAKEGAAHGVRANVVCPGFVQTPLVEKQIPEQALALGISEADVVKNVMLKDTVDGEFTTLEDVAATALFFCRVSIERADGPIARRQSRLVYGVSAVASARAFAFTVSRISRTTPGG